MGAQDKFSKIDTATILRVMVDKEIAELGKEIDINFLVELEGWREVPYVLPPEQFPRSGITIGFGVDLGQFSYSDMLHILAKFVTPTEARMYAEIVKPFLLLKGEAAKAKLRMAKKIIDADTVNIVSYAMLLHFLTQLKKQFPKFNKLSREAKTLILSIFWHRGFAGVKRSETWHQVVVNIKDGNYNRTKILIEYAAKRNPRYKSRYQKYLAYLQSNLLTAKA